MPAPQPVSYGVVNVGLADAVVLPADPSRLGLLISNPGPNPIWIAFGAPAVANQSILIPAGGAPVFLRAEDWPQLFQMDMHAITTGAAGKLAGLSRVQV